MSLFVIGIAITGGSLYKPTVNLADKDYFVKNRAKLNRLKKKKG